MLKKAWQYMKHQWFPTIAAYSAKYVLRMLLGTCRLKIKGFEHVTEAAETSACILMLWHNRLIIVSEILYKLTNNDQTVTALVSKSRDGDPLAILIESYSRGHALRVAHNSRHSALVQLIAILKKKQDIVVITPDGPRGPCYEVKPGIIMAARESNAQIVPLNWVASKQWELKTWDRMRIPKPFSTIHIEFGTPILLTNQENSLEKDASVLHDTLMDLEKYIMR